MIPRNDPPSRTSGYLGGVFSKDTVVGFGFRLQNERTQETHVLEIDDNAVSLIAVRPGRYNVRSWLTWGLLDREIFTEQTFAEGEPFGGPFDVEAGHVILLGEWSADRHLDFRHNMNTFTILKIRLTEAGAIRMLQ